MLVPVHGYKNNFRGAAFHAMVGTGWLRMDSEGGSAFGADRSKWRNKREERQMKERKIKKKSML